VILNPSHQKGKGTPVKNLKIPRGSWEYSELFRDILVAKDWGLDPIEFWNRSKLSRALMIAFTEENAAMDGFDRNVKA